MTRYKKGWRVEQFNDQTFYFCLLSDWSLGIYNPATKERQIITEDQADLKLSEPDLYRKMRKGRKVYLLRLPNNHVKALYYKRYFTWLENIGWMRG